MGWVERRWKHVVFIAALSTTVVSTTAVAAPAVAGPKVPGIDVSKYQGRIDWDAVATTPVRFVIMRATLGNHTATAGTHGTSPVRDGTGSSSGAYHFAKPGLARRDPRVEADHFLRRRSASEPGDVMPVLDIEETGGLGPRQLRTWASAWLERVYERTGVRAMIYSGNYFWHGFMRNTTWFAHRDHPLWVAHWYVGAPDVPGGRWAGRGYTVWQWSAAGRIAGIDGPVDRDWMNGEPLPGDGGVDRRCARRGGHGHGRPPRLRRSDGFVLPARQSRRCDRAARDPGDGARFDPMDGRVRVRQARSGRAS